MERKRKKRNAKRRRQRWARRGEASSSYWTLAAGIRTGKTLEVERWAEAARARGESVIVLGGKRDPSRKLFSTNYDFLVPNDEYRDGAWRQP